MGTQKNRLNETVLLSTKNTCFDLYEIKLLKVYANKISLSGPINKYIDGHLLGKG